MYLCFWYAYEALSVSHLSVIPLHICTFSIVSSKVWIKIINLANKIIWVLADIKSFLFLHFTGLFTCSNGQQIPDDFQCDDSKDCADKSDEIGCGKY